MERIRNSSETTNGGGPAELGVGGVQPWYKDPERRRMVFFVVRLVAYVLLMLTAYRYAINTRPNIWYLFQVARHTCAVLDLVGHHCTLENTLPTVKSEVVSMRRNLARWKGEGPPAADQEATPMSAWEQWQFRAYQTIRMGGTLQDEGPYVGFVAWPGLWSRIAALERRMDDTRANVQLTENQRNDLLAKLREERDALLREDARVEGHEDAALIRQDAAFAFRVVPDCGAIPLMAIYVAAVLAFPATWRRRGLGLLFGLPILYGVNLVRLSSLAYVGVLDRTPDDRYFTFAHEFIWQGVFLVFVAVFWMAWIEFVVQRKGR